MAVELNSTDFPAFLCQRILHPSKHPMRTEQRWSILLYIFTLQFDKLFFIAYLYAGVARQAPTIS